MENQNNNNNGRAYKAIKNFSYGLINDLVALVCGLILPKLILENYGSAYNGITHSISQFISVIALMKSGIGSATRAALYKPLAENDNKEISEIMASSSSFMRRIASIFAIFVVIFSVFYPLLVEKEFGWIFTSSLILIISISTFAEYYFGFSYQMLLVADQKQHIIACLSIFTTVINAIVSVILINRNYVIHVVKLGNTIVSCITPIILYFYVNRKYNLQKIGKINTNKISQRWDAFAHEVATFVNNNTDVMILTAFTNLLEVSVYSVYHMVTANLKKIIYLFTSSFAGAFGNMYAKKEMKVMEANLRIYELIVHSLSSVLFSVTLIMIVPFVVIYTKKISDVNYNRQAFAVLSTYAVAFENFRTPYRTIISASGHFKDTKSISYIEAALNIVISVISVVFIGLNGVAVGTLFAMIFGTIGYAYYASKYIMNRKLSLFVKRAFLTVLTMFIMKLVSNIYMPQLTVFSNFGIWIIYAVINTLLSTLLTLLIILVFYKEDLMSLIKKVSRIITRKV